MSAVKISEERTFSAPLKFWLALVATVAAASVAWAGLASAVNNHEGRLRMAELKLEDVKDMKNDLKWMVKMMEEERASRARKQ